MAKEGSFSISNIKVVFVLNTPRPEEKENEHIKENEHTKDNEICIRHVLDAISNALFGIYNNVPTIKELWEMLESIYLQKDVASKKFIVSQFNSYKMNDSRSIME